MAVWLQGSIRFASQWDHKSLSLTARFTSAFGALLLNMEVVVIGSMIHLHGRHAMKRDLKAEQRLARVVNDAQEQNDNKSRLMPDASGTAVKHALQTESDARWRITLDYSDQLYLICIRVIAPMRIGFS